MCGIAGIYYFDKRRPVEAVLVQRALDTIAHRGPDDEGIWTDEGVVLGFRRLSIIDLSAAGHQPMSNGRRDLCVVLNGEIYNYRELQDSLKGFQFRSRTDTEVLINAYDTFGDNCVMQFNGMWGFAIFDKRTNTLFCARDRFGVKPFYYYHDNERFVFASEIKALLAMGVPARENKKSIFEYLAYGNLDTTFETLFEGINQVLPGHTLTIRCDGVETPRRYWLLPDLDNEDSLLSLDDAASNFRDLFLDAVSLRLRSDVPVGILLSGGIDSSSIVCAVDYLRNKRGLNEANSVKAFAAVYDDPNVDESEYIDAVTQWQKIECIEARFIQ